MGVLRFATVHASAKAPYDPGYKYGQWQGGGTIGSFRCYRAYHPAARIHIVSHRGRAVWMTGKQYDIWSAIQAMHRRQRHLTLGRLADLAHCSRATVSRFLHRLAFWHFIDLEVIFGRRGGVVVTTVDRMWRSVQTMRETAKAERSWLGYTLRARNLWDEYQARIVEALRGGSTGATFGVQLPLKFGGGAY